VSSAAWFVAIAAFGGFAYWLWRAWRKWLERSQASSARLEEFVASAKGGAAPAPQAVPPVAPAAAPVATPMPAPAQKLLFEAASKAAEAGEAALSIQLYARLLSRYPDTALAPMARAAVEVQKKNLVKS